MFLMQATQQDAPRRKALAGAKLHLYERLEIDGGRLLPELVRDTEWSHEHITLFDKTYPQPRLVAYYGDPGASYTYSGTLHPPLPWTNRLLELRKPIEKLCRYSFNSVLLNYYRNEEDAWACMPTTSQNWASSLSLPR